MDDVDSLREATRVGKIIPASEQAFSYEFAGVSLQDLAIKLIRPMQIKHIALD